MVKESYEEKGILQPKNDVVFQALFGRGKENVRKRNRDRHNYRNDRLK